MLEENEFQALGLGDLYRPPDPATIPKCTTPKPANEMPDSIHFKSHVIMDGMPSIRAFPSNQLSRTVSSSVPSFQATTQPTGTSGGASSQATQVTEFQFLPCTKLGSNFPCHLEPHPRAFVEYMFGLQLGYRQSWTFLGYTLGDLINSISLPPSSKTKIETFTWDRHTRHEETELSEDTETSSEYNTTNRDTQEILKEVTKTSSSNVSGGINLNLKVVKIGASGSAQNTVTSHNKRTSSHISEVTSKAAQKYKSTRKMKVSESEEYGSETRITKEIENTNRGYAVTYQFYEILRNYKLDLYLENVIPVIYIPYSIPEINLNFIRCYEGTIKKYLLDKSFLSAFNSIRRYRCFTETKTAEVDDAFKAIASAILEQYDTWANSGFPLGEAQELDWLPYMPNSVLTKIRDEWLTTAINTLRNEAASNPHQALTIFIQSWVDYRQSLNASQRYVTRFIDFLEDLNTYKRLTEWYEEISKQEKPTIEETERDRHIDDLICHLNENKLYYLHKIWAKEDAGERYIRFEMYNPIYGISLNDLVDPEPLGFFGNMGAFTLRLDVPSEDDLRRYIAFQWSNWVKSGGELAKRFSPEFIFEDYLGLIEATENESKTAGGNKIKEDELVFRFPLNIGQILANAALYEKKSQKNWVAEEPTEREKYTVEWIGRDNFISGFDHELFFVSLYRALAEGMKELGKDVNSSQLITTPTTGIFCESMLGECSACEPFIRKHRDYDLLSKKQDVKKQKLENKHLKARLDDKNYYEPDKQPSPVITANIKLHKDGDQEDDE